MSIFDNFLRKKIENQEHEIRLIKVLSELENQIVNDCSVQINWSHSINEAPKLYDCSFDDMLDGFDLFALEAKDGKMLDDDSLLFYNSTNKTREGKIATHNQGIICCKGIGFDNELNEQDKFNEKYDGIFIVNFSKIHLSADSLMFFIGRPKTDSSPFEGWINKRKVQKVLNEKVYIDIFINEVLVKSYCAFYYNKWGALKILEFVRYSENWKINLDNHEFKNGLQEIVNQYRK